MHSQFRLLVPTLQRRIFMGAAWGTVGAVLAAEHFSQQINDEIMGEDAPGSLRRREMHAALGFVAGLLVPTLAFAARAVHSQLRRRSSKVSPHAPVATHDRVPPAAAYAAVHRPGSYDGSSARAALGCSRQARVRTAAVASSV